MKIPEYITVEEVRRVCKELMIRDWTKMKDSKVLLKEARIILAQVNTAGMKINLEDFRKGLEVELEQGTGFKDASVTNKHPQERRRDLLFLGDLAGRGPAVWAQFSQIQDCTHGIVGLSCDLHMNSILFGLNGENYRYQGYFRVFGVELQVTEIIDSGMTFDVGFWV